jgi:hypothetical protein
VGRPPRRSCGRDLWDGVVTAPNPQVTTGQVAGLPAELGQAVRDLVDESVRKRHVL